VKSKPSDQKQNTAVDTAKQLYIGNIPGDVTDDAIRKTFPEAVDVRILRKKGSKTIFGFLHFDSEPTAETVKLAKEAAGGVMLGGLRVTVDYCGEKSSRFRELTKEKNEKQATKATPTATATPAKKTAAPTTPLAGKASEPKSAEKGKQAQVSAKKPAEKVKAPSPTDSAKKAAKGVHFAADVKKAV